MAACVTHDEDVYACARHAQYELRLMRRSMKVAHVVWTTLIAYARADVGIVGVQHGDDTWHTLIHLPNAS